jgi:TatD DNase family protein
MNYHLCRVLINLHTHSPTLAPGVLALESIYAGQVNPPVSHWQSVGLHPWYLPEPWNSAREWLESQAVLPITLAIGEAGLDKVCSTPWTLQEAAFTYCIELSERVEKPLIIHCVRAHAEVLQLKKVLKARQPWIFHGFDKNLATAQMILNAGAFLSFGSSLFRENNPAAKVLPHIPMNQFFLETDVSAWTIQEVYERAAKLRGWSLAALEQQMEENFRDVFGVLSGGGQL